MSHKSAEDRSNYERLRSRRLAEAGLCRRCRQSKEGTFVNCNACRLKIQEYHAARKSARRTHEYQRAYKLKQQYCCLLCMEPLSDTRFVRCQNCRKKLAENVSRWRMVPKSKETEAKYDALYRKRTQVRLKKALRARIWAGLKGRNKTSSVIGSLGCSIDDLKRHLEMHFTLGMSWDNYGHGLACWTIDHTIPLASVDLTNPTQFAQVCHYTNLRPMWFSENVSKGAKTVWSGNH